MVWGPHQLVKLTCAHEEAVFQESVSPLTMTDRKQVTEARTVLRVGDTVELKAHIERMQELLAQGYTSIEIDEGEYSWGAQVLKTRLESDEEYLLRHAKTEHQKTVWHATYLKLYKRS